VVLAVIAVVGGVTGWEWYKVWQLYQAKQGLQGTREQSHEPKPAEEGPGDGDGGKYRLLTSIGLKHLPYLRDMQRKIESEPTVPQFPQGHSAVGKAHVGFTVRRNGELAEVVLLRSSGDPAMDEALIQAVRRGELYPPFPDDMPDQQISIRVFASLH
jgi:TonB family protein